jgi:hypothetical protein
MRELYSQYVAYTQMFVDRVPTYKPNDNKILSVSNALGNGLTNICSSVAFKSAQPVAPLVANPPAPSNIMESSKDAQPEPFISAGDNVCVNVASLVKDFDAETSAWRSLDPQIPASKWTAEQRALNDAVVPVMNRNADELIRIGSQSSSPVFNDFATLAAQYRRAFAITIRNYSAPDNYLSESASFLVKSLNLACEASG